LLPILRDQRLVFLMESFCLLVILGQEAVTQTGHWPGTASPESASSWKPAAIRPWYGP